ncbi:MAG TPA: ribonuclease Z [Blastocatellia bacterium]|jgi:ribonuclease Z|nr:ribonuclease Z [Blastocatellia bacterium]
MKVIPLGTSSGKPTLKRTVSALAVAREGEWLLLDCGEGTQMQIMRAGLSPSRLVSIFITHLHGDHFNGLSGLLSTMGLDRRARLLSLAGPRGILEYLETLARLKILFVNFPLDLQEFTEPGPGAREYRRERVRMGEWSPDDSRGSRLADALSTETPASVYEGEAYRVSALPLDHRIFAVGYRIEERPRPGVFNIEKARALGIPPGPLFGRLQSGHDVQLASGLVIRPSDVLGPERKGKSIAYCTDTRPFAASVELARDADLLIHEATYTEELVREADEYGHSTAAQAARIARAAGAKHLLLTHFSSRYNDLGPLLDEARSIFPNTSLAQELVEVDV